MPQQRHVEQREVAAAADHPLVRRPMLAERLVRQLREPPEHSLRVPQVDLWPPLRRDPVLRPVAITHVMEDQWRHRIPQDGDIRREAVQHRRLCTGVAERAVHCVVRERVIVVGHGDSLR